MQIDTKMESISGTFSKKNWFLESVSKQIHDPENARYYFIRLGSLIIMMIFAISHALHGEPTNVEFPEGIVDHFHNWTLSWNTWLKDNRLYLNAWLIYAGALMDASTLMFIVGIVSKERVLRSILGLLFVFNLRSFFLTTFEMPIAQGYEFGYPGFPSMTFPYGVFNDFFFSGHVSSTMFMALDHYHSGWNFAAGATLFTCLNQFPLMIATRGHYSIDLFAGVIFGHWIFLMTDRLCDYLYAKHAEWREARKEQRRSSEILYERLT